MEPIIFRSKVDTWLKVVLAASALICAGAVLAPGIAGAPLATLAVSPLLLLGVGLPVWLLRSTFYTLRESELEVRSGPFRWTIPVNEIQRLTHTRSAVSSPALSLDRIRIDYGRGRWLMVSPEDPAAFVALLEERGSRFRRG